MAPSLEDFEKYREGYIDKLERDSVESKIWDFQNFVSKDNALLLSKYDQRDDE